MNGWSALDRFPRTDPRDVGCEQAMEMLSIYVELVAIDAPAEQRPPGIAAHLRSCGPCGEDFEGLLAASRDARTDCHTLLPAPVARPQSFLLGPSLG